MEDFEYICALQSWSMCLVENVNSYLPSTTTLYMVYNLAPTFINASF